MNRVYIGQRRQYGGMYHPSSFGGRQTGGSLFATLGSFMKPLAGIALKALRPVAQQAAKTAGHMALAKGANVVGDIFRGRNLQQSVQKRAGEGAQQLVKTLKPTVKRALLTSANERIQQALKPPPQTGKGRKRKRKQKGGGCKKKAAMKGGCKQRGSGKGKPKRKKRRIAPPLF